jgi:hypothetical protein
MGRGIAKDYGRRVLRAVSAARILLVTMMTTPSRPTKTVKTTWELELLAGQVPALRTDGEARAFVEHALSLGLDGSHPAVAAVVRRWNPPTPDLGRWREVYDPELGYHVHRREAYPEGGYWQPWGKRLQVQVHEAAVRVRRCG